MSCAARLMTSGMEENPAVQATLIPPVVVLQAPCVDVDVSRMMRFGWAERMA